jgi:hypothetical protein
MRAIIGFPIANGEVRRADPAVRGATGEAVREAPIVKLRPITMTALVASPGDRLEVLSRRDNLLPSQTRA